MGHLFTAACSAFLERRAAWVAVVAASLWMLHPYWVSTTLYVVQRMTILSALFMLAGMVGYLKGRLWLMQPTQHRRLASLRTDDGQCRSGHTAGCTIQRKWGLTALAVIGNKVFCTVCKPMHRREKSGFQ